MRAQLARIFYFTFPSSLERIQVGLSARSSSSPLLEPSSKRASSRRRRHRQCTFKPLKGR